MATDDDFIPFEDDVIEAADATEHEGDGSKHAGDKASRERYRKNVDDLAPKTNPDTGEIVALDERSAEPVPFSAEPIPLLCNVAPADAKRMLAEKLAAATAAFGKFEMPPKPKKAANDNHRGKESWPLLEQITRGGFERDKFIRAKMIQAVHRIRYLVDTTGVDVVGLSVHLPGKETPVDFGLQRTTHGKIVYEQGQTLDRKWRTYNAKDGEESAKRYDGPVRTVRGSLVDKSDFDPTRDDPVAFRLIEASDELEEIVVSVGPPLWPHLFAAICENRTFTEIGATTGAKHTQAPGVGSALIKMALLAAMKAIDDCAEQENEAKRPQKQKKPAFGTPAPARRLKRALEAAQMAA